MLLVRLDFVKEPLFRSFYLAQYNHFVELPGKDILQILNSGTRFHLFVLVEYYFLPPQINVHKAHNARSEISCVDFCSSGSLATHNVLILFSIALHPFSIVS